MGTLHYFPVKERALHVPELMLGQRLDIAAQRAYSRHVKNCREVLVASMRRIWMGCYNVQQTSSDPYAVSLANGVIMDIERCVNDLDNNVIPPGVN